MPIESIKRQCSYCALAHSRFLYIEIWIIKSQTRITVQKLQSGQAQSHSPQQSICLSHEVTEWLKRSLLHSKVYASAFPLASGHRLINCVSVPSTHFNSHPLLSIPYISITRILLSQNTHTQKKKKCISVMNISLYIYHNSHKICLNQILGVEPENGYPVFHFSKSVQCGMNCNFVVACV